MDTKSIEHLVKLEKRTQQDMAPMNLDNLDTNRMMNRKERREALKEQRRENRKKANH